MKHKNVKNTYIVIHNGTENHFFTVNGSLLFFLRARKKISHGSPSNINQHTLSESHAKFGAFIRPVTVISLSHLTRGTECCTSHYCLIDIFSFNICYMLSKYGFSSRNKWRQNFQLKFQGPYPTGKLEKKEWLYCILFAMKISQLMSV